MKSKKLHDAPKRHQELQLEPTIDFTEKEIITKIHCDELCLVTVVPSATPDSFGICLIESFRLLDVCELVITSLLPIRYNRY